MKRVVKLNLDMGVEGAINSLFICTDEELAWLHGKWADFGSCLGRHSDVQTLLDLDDFTVVDLSPESVAEIENTCGKSICGLNPFNYVT